MTEFVLLIKTLNILNSHNFLTTAFFPMMCDTVKTFEAVFNI